MRDCSGHQGIAAYGSTFTLLVVCPTIVAISTWVRALVLISVTPIIAAEKIITNTIAIGDTLVLARAQRCNNSTSW